MLSPVFKTEIDTKISLSIVNTIYQHFFRKLLFKLDPETAHDLTCDILGVAETLPFVRNSISRILKTPDHKISLFGLSFPNCLGLAAGLDKNAMFSGVSSALGFGHIEVGTVTPVSQPGNPKPRLFRYPDQRALINRMGFNNLGSEALAERLNKYNPKGSRTSPVGINIGKAKNTSPDLAIEDYLSAFKNVASQADYITINISSPNTIGLRLLHQKDFLDPLLNSIQSLNKQLSTKSFQRPLPCLIKISPDEDFNSLETIIQIALENKIDGIIATNTTLKRYPSNSGSFFEKGGLSGEPLALDSLEIIKFITKETNNMLPVIGVGGINDTNSAHKKLDAGASLLQLYTALIYNGPLFPSRLVKSLKTRYLWP